MNAQLFGLTTIEAPLSKTSGFHPGVALADSL